jgi:hypothetical protein
MSICNVSFVVMPSDKVTDLCQDVIARVEELRHQAIEEAIAKYLTPHTPDPGFWGWLQRKIPVKPCTREEAISHLKALSKDIFTYERSYQRMMK